MAVITVGSQTELQSALKSANGGDTIVLKDANYGTLNITESYGSTVTITAQNEDGAVFGDVVMNNSANLTFEGISVDAFRAYSSEGIGLKDSTVDGIVYMKNVDGLVVDGNDIEGNFHALLINDVQNFTVANNYIHGAQEDLMRVTGDSYNGEIENNYFFDTVPKDYRNDGDASTSGYNHSDFLQMFGSNGNTPHDITIRQNVMYDDRSTGDKTVTPQGIFISDPHKGGYYNLLIEENLIAVNSSNSIAINGGQHNVVVQNNTLMPLNGGGAIIRLADTAGYDNSGTTVTGNVMKVLYDQTGSSTIGDNYIYGRSADFSALFQGGSMDWTAFLAVAGSELEASGMGAVDFLNYLLNGGDWLKGSSTGTGTDTGSKPGTGTGGTPDNGSGAETPAEPAPAEPAPAEPAPAEPAPAEPAPAEPAPAEPERSPAEIVAGQVVYSRAGALEVSSSRNVVEVAHDEAMEIDAGIIALSFNADKTSGWTGILTKDAYGFTGGGNHFAIYVADGELRIRFQDGSAEVIFAADIKTHTTYDLQVEFGDGEVAAWLNGKLIGTADFDMTLATNVEYLQIGALGWSSDTGKSGFKGTFDGTISDVTIASAAPLEVEETPAEPPAPEPETDTGSGPIVDPEPEAPVTEPEVRVPAEIAGEQIVFTRSGALEVSSAIDVVELAPTEDLALESGIIALSFNADKTSGWTGILSKDAYGYTGGGNHFTVYVVDGELRIRFQDGSADVIFGADIKTHTDYDLQVEFGDGEVAAWLNGELIGTAASAMTWDSNAEYMQIGALGWSGDTGKSGFKGAFDGTISDVTIASTAAASAQASVTPDAQESPEDLTLTGSMGNDTIVGGTGDDLLRGKGRSDKLDGGAGHDELRGGLGSDELHGGDGNDRLSGGKGSDVLFGEAGDDTLYGRQSNDLLDGGAGNDTLEGGHGDDIFVFGDSHGNDVISDFTIGEDLIWIDRTTTAAIEYDDLGISQVGNDTVIDTGDSTITLLNVNMADLSIDDFFFS